MQELLNYYMNKVAPVAVTAILLCLNAGAAAVAVRLFHRKISVVKWITFTLTFVMMGYIAASALLFTVDWYGIRKPLVLQLAAALALIAFRVLRGRKSGTLVWAELDTDLRPYLLPLVLALIGLVVSWGNFGYFGMGQDQGVYQVKAITLMNGDTGRVYSFREEYEALDSEEEKEAFFNDLVGRQLGFDLIDATLEENQVLSSLRTGGNAGHHHTDGIFHGIPTWPALLALWGTLFGTGSMSGVQTLLYILALLTLWFTTENLGLKKRTSVLVCTLFMLSPEVVWSSKSTLTEMLLALIIIRFLYDLTCRERPDRRWWSAWMAVMFALVHVSIFAVIPMFLLLYLVLYLWNGDRQYARAMRISALGFMGGFTFMTLTAPRYTIRNTAIIWFGPVTLGNVYWIFMAFGFVALAVSFLLPRLRVKGRFRAFAAGRGCAWLVRILVLLLLAASVFMSVTRSAQTDPLQVVTTNGFYNMIWMTGLIFLPTALVALLRKPGNFLKDEATLGLTVLFGCLVLIMCCVLKWEVSYCYYFGRYLTPYIPVACVIIGLAWNRYSGRLVGAGAAVCALLFTPFDLVMLWRQDDTFTSWETLSRVTESVTTAAPADTAVIFEDYPLLFMHPVKTITGDACFFGSGDVELQASKLSAKYKTVFVLTQSEMDWKTVTSFWDACYLDDNVSYRPALCPFPLSFLHMTKQFNLYQYGGGLIFTPADLVSDAATEGETLVLEKGQSQSGPDITLPPGAYEARLSGSGLSGVSFFPTVEHGVMMDYVLESQEDGEVVVSFSSAVDMVNVEFVTRNRQDSPAVVERIRVVRLGDP